MAVMMRYTGGTYDGRDWTGLYDTAELLDVITHEGKTYTALEGCADMDRTSSDAVSGPTIPGLMLFDEEKNMVYAQAADLADCDENPVSKSFELKRGVWERMVKEVAAKMDTLDLKVEKEEPHREGVNLRGAADGKQTDMSL